MIYLQLFWEFFKAGLFAVGGGLATLPFLYDIGERTGWYTAADVADMIAVAESTPGPIGINMATYTGFTCGGIPGAIIATMGLVVPSILVITLVILALERFRRSRWVEAGFYGLRPASAAMIAAAGFSVLYISILDMEAFQSSGMILNLFRWDCVVLAVVLWIGSNLVPKVKKFHPVFFIAISAAAGILFRLGGV